MTDESNAYKKPVPTLRDLAGEFYSWCKRHELRFQRCSACAAWRHTPREICAACGSWSWEWAPSSGRGHVFTWTTAMRAMDPAFSADVPYAAVVVEMEEGVRIVSRVHGCDPADLTIGMPVVVAFDNVTDDVTLPVFRRAG